MLTDIKQNEIFDAFHKLIPYLKIFFEEETIFGINNTEYCLALVNDTSIPMKANAGDKLTPGSAAYRAIRDKQVVNGVVSKEVYGIPLKSISIPIKENNGEVVGNIAIAKSLKKQEEVSDLSKNLSLALNQISDAIGQISSGIQSAGKSSEDILMNLKGANEKTKNTDEVLEFIKNVANKTNLLGLNAAIESSRAGEAGKGFEVVAKEIRKLSSSSSESVKKIEKVIKEIQKSVSNVTDNVNEVNGIFQEQAAALEEITASIQELNETAKLLEQMASKF
ncbi:MAG: methyl-accepting chemotaxis protein [Clostridium sp.]|nr:methyl-accepting chemotaxis protein [Clostridium sp.]